MEEGTNEQRDNATSGEGSQQGMGRRSGRRFDRRRHQRNRNANEPNAEGAENNNGSDDSSSTDRGEKSGSQDRQRSERQERPERQERSERQERPERRERSFRAERSERGQRSERQDRGSKPSISVVIPLLNEEESLPELVARLVPVLETQSGGRYEVLFIDDGSTDTSWEVLRTLHRRNGRIHANRFRRNYGKSAALAVGFAQAKNDIVITMDADLQDDPLEIPNLIAMINEGYDLVSGWKKRRKDPLEKRLPSKFFNYVTSVVSGIKLHDFNCGLKAYRRDVIKTVQVYGEMHRYIPALAHWEGFRIAELPVTHHARKFGNSKFGFSRYFKGFLDLLTVVFTTRFIKRPLHLFGTLGSLFTITGFCIDLYLSIEWWLKETSLTNRPLMLMGIAFIIVGVQLISIGLIGEMIVKNSLSHAEYSVKERL